MSNSSDGGYSSIGNKITAPNAKFQAEDRHRVLLLFRALGAHSYRATSPPLPGGGDNSQWQRFHSGSSCGRWPAVSHFQARQTQGKLGDRLVANKPGDHCINSSLWGSVLNMGCSRRHLISAACVLMPLKFIQLKSEVNISEHLWGLGITDQMSREGFLGRDLSVGYQGRDRL